MNDNYFEDVYNEFSTQEYLTSETASLITTGNPQGLITTGNPQGLITTGHDSPDTNNMIFPFALVALSAVVIAGFKIKSIFSEPKKKSKKVKNSDLNTSSQNPQNPIKQGFETPIVSAITGFETPIVSAITGVVETPIVSAIKGFETPIVSAIKGFETPIAKVFRAQQEQLKIKKENMRHTNIPIFENTRPINIPIF